jgi:YidC/Oxa1 family membrane protein insertase
MTEAIDNILYPLMFAVAWLMVQFHSLLTAMGLPSDSGLAWALSIVGLVIVIRILLIPLFVKQIKASRGMQLLAPEMQAIQKKYKGKTDPASREAMSRETMDLYKKHGTNPFSSCLPILAQSPVFFALFRVLFTLTEIADGTYARPSIGPLDRDLAADASSASLFGAQISETFLGSDSTQVKIVTVALIVLMSATTFTTQRQLTQKNMPASALTGPMAQQQKMLLYILPLVFAISGVNFPIGVLIYWSTTNLWSMGQQFYVIRRNPTPGSEAERALKERRARKAAAKGIVLEEDRPAVEEKPRGQREQPKRKARTKPVPGEPGSRPASGATALNASPASGSTKPGAKGPTGGAAAGGSGAAGTSGARKAAGGQRPPGAKQGAGGQTGGSRGPAASTGVGGAPAGGPTEGASTGPVDAQGVPTDTPSANGRSTGPSAPAGTGTGAATRPTRKPRTPKK